MRPLAAALAATLLLAGCGGDEPQREQLRPGELTLLSARVAAVREAVVAADRYAALDAAVALRETVQALRPRLAPDEEAALTLAVGRLTARIRADIPPPREEEALEEESLIPVPDEKPGKGRGKAKGHKKKGKD